MLFLHRWGKYVDLPESHPHRQFCHHLVTHLVRMSFWERIAQVRQQFNFCFFIIVQLAF